jgi:hypothetical protein
VTNYPETRIVRKSVFLEDQGEAQFENSMCTQAETISKSRQGEFRQPF